MPQFFALRSRGDELSGINFRGIYRREHGGKIEDILRKLWTLVVKPILDGLGYRVPPSTLSRIWWCTTGPLAFLPIHAAGIYARSSANPGYITENTITLSDFAISSYTPTVRGLAERVKRRRAIDEQKVALFLISQPNTPKLPRIPATTKEVHVIETLLRNHDIRILCLEKEAATVNQGMINMETHSCIHFACHACQNSREPLKSRFELHDGPLELSSIIQMKLEGDLAFLSACQTSAGDEKLSEEAVHLAAGMLAAGYRGVVATMWSIQDRYGPQVAEDFYRSLLNHEGKSEGLSGDNAARALHYATQRLRKELDDSEFSLLIWVPYVHFGL